MHIEPFVYYLFMTHPTACIRFTDRPASGLDLLALAPSAEIGRSVGPPHPQPERASRPVEDASHEVSRRALPSHKFWAGRARALARRTPPHRTDRAPLHLPHPSAPSSSSSSPVRSVHYNCRTLRRRICLTKLIFDALLDVGPE